MTMSNVKGVVEAEEPTKNYRSVFVDSPSSFFIVFGLSQLA